jgi:hypothetical protein
MGLTFKPTILMIKQHSITGLKYFHKTTKLNKINTYSGSGKYWLRHLEKHGNSWVNLWVSEVFYDADLCQEFALLFSELHEIDVSPDWANLIPENGINGGDNPASRTREVIDRRVASFKKTVSENPWKHSDSFKERRALDMKTYWDSEKGNKRKEELYKNSVNEFKDFFIGPPKPRGWIINNKANHTCRFCGKVGDLRNMKRWHGDNCRNKD